MQRWGINKVGRIGIGNAPHGVAVVPIVGVGRVQVATVEVQVVRVVGTTRRTGPVAALRASIDEAAGIDAPGITNLIK